MTTKTVNLYTFNELSDSAKEKARNWWREGNNDDTFWSECTIDEAKEQAKNMGFDVEEILWSGFSSQGNGACFTGRWNSNDFGPEKVADGWGESDSTAKIKQIGSAFGEFSKQYPELQVKISPTDRYCHVRSVDYDFYVFDQETGEEIDRPENFSEKDFKESCVDLFQWIYRQLEKDWDYNNSDECVDENITNNDYTFLADGTRED